MYEIRSTEHKDFYICERVELAGGEAHDDQCEGCGHPRHQGLCMSLADCNCGAETEKEYVN